MPSARPTVTAADFLPPTDDLGELAAAADACRGCDLFEHATHTVFGAGPARARMMLVGEQPGDQEDRRVNRSSVRPGGCSTRRCARRGSTVRRCM